MEQRKHTDDSNNNSHYQLPNAEGTLYQQLGTFEERLKKNKETMSHESLQKEFSSQEDELLMGYYSLLNDYLKLAEKNKNESCAPELEKIYFHVYQSRTEYVKILNETMEGAIFPEDGEIQPRDDLKEKVWESKIRILDILYPESKDMLENLYNAYNKSRHPYNSWRYIVMTKIADNFRCGGLNKAHDDPERIHKIFALNKEKKKPESVSFAASELFIRKGDKNQYAEKVSKVFAVVSKEELYTALHAIHNADLYSWSPDDPEGIIPAMGMLLDHENEKVRENCAYTLYMLVSANDGIEWYYGGYRDKNMKKAIIMPILWNKLVDLHGMSKSDDASFVKTLSTYYDDLENQNLATIAKERDQWDESDLYDDDEDDDDYWEEESEPWEGYDKIQYP